MCLAVLVSGVAFEVVGYFDGCARDECEFGFPFVVAVDVGKGYYVAFFQDLEFVSELGFSTGCEPDVERHQGGTDDGCFFGFYECYFFVRVSGKEVFSEEALGELPVFWKLAPGFQDGVYSGDSGWGVRAFDPMSGDGVVFHYLAGPASVFCVNLVVDDAAVFCDSEFVFVDEAFEDEGVYDGAEALCECAVDCRAYGLFDYGWWYGAEWWLMLWLCFSLGLVCRDSPVACGGFGVGVVLEVVGWAVLVSAGGFVVAASYVVGYGVAVFVDVEREASFAAAGRAGVPGLHTCVGLEFIGVSVHCLVALVHCPFVHLV